MRIKVTHETSYRYAPPARSAIQLLRLKPRDHEGQHVLSWRIDVEPGARLCEAEDCFGNVTQIFNIDGPLGSLVISVDGEIEVSDASGLVSGAREPFPPMVFLRDTALTAPSDALRAFAARQSAGTTADRLALLHEMMIALNALIRFEVGEADVTITAAEAFARGRGVCQDFAHMFIAAARSIEIPARYVSGYLARQDEASVQNAGHAWAEAYVEGLGWIGFDAANGVCPTDAYVRVAVGLDYLGAAPVRGARQGGGQEKLGVRVAIDAVSPQTQN